MRDMETVPASLDSCPKKGIVPTAKQNYGPIADWLLIPIIGRDIVRVRYAATTP